MLHGQWSSPSLGKVGGRKLVFFGGGDGRCYAFEALASVPEKPVKLKTVWSFDCIPPEYKAVGGLGPGDALLPGRQAARKGTRTSNDGTFVGMSEIIGTPVFYNNRVYVAIGRDPAHGRGRGALHCIDATKTGDITKTGRSGPTRAWTARSPRCRSPTACSTLRRGRAGSTASTPRPGKCYWVHDTNCEVWGSTLVADGKVYMPTSKGLWCWRRARR